MPDWLSHLLGDDVLFWLSYLTNGKHLAWYASLRFTISAAVLGAAFALFFGLAGASMMRSRFFVVRAIGKLYANIVRGVPDVLFFLFFPLAFEQFMEGILATQVCTAADVAASAGRWPPCSAANIFFDTTQYLLLASVSLGIVYGAFASSVINGAMNAVPKGQLEAARAYGMRETQVLWRIQIRQMWIYALPGLSNVWMLLLKATSLLSLLQIADIVLWANRLGAPNFISRVGLVHGDWRWKYYLVLFILYIVMTMVSERVFAALRRRFGHGIIAKEELA